MPAPTSDDSRLDALVAAFATLDPRTGVTFRGRTMDSRFGREGQLVATRNLTATSRSVAVATENFCTPALYVVLGHSGRSVAPMSRFPDELEVVLLPGTVLRVVKSARVDDLPVTVVAEVGGAAHDSPPVDLQEVAAFAVDRVRRARAEEPVVVTTPGKFAGDIV